jgi:hypothetical protein
MERSVLSPAAGSAGHSASVSKLEVDPEQLYVNIYNTPDITPNSHKKTPNFGSPLYALSKSSPLLESVKKRLIFSENNMQPSLADELSETAQSIMCKIEQVPTILSSLCQEILRNGLKVDFLFMTIPHDFQRYESVKSELSINTTHSYEDVYITVKLLQSFLEELPEPLVLYSLYSQAINFTAYLFNQAVDQLCNKHAIYKSLVQFTQVECYEDIWEYLWKPIQADNVNTHIKQQLALVASEYLLNVRTSSQYFEDWLSQLPSVNKNVLEYLTVFLIQLSISSTARGNSLEESTYMFSKYLLIPASVSEDEGEMCRNNFLRTKFYLLLSYQIKKRYKLFTSSDQELLNQTEEQFLATIVEKLEILQIIKPFINDTTPIVIRNKADAKPVFQELFLDDICPNEVVELPSPYKQRDFVAENQHFANEWPYGEDFSLTASAPASGTSTDNVINNILAFAPYLHNWINEPNFELPSWCNDVETNEKPENPFDFSQYKRDQDAKNCSKCQYEFKKFDLLSRNKKFCQNCGSALCSACATLTDIIPRKVLERADFRPRDVCSKCKEKLQSDLVLPALSIEALKPKVSQSISKSKWDKFHSLREKAVRSIFYYFLPDCPARFFLYPCIYFFLLMD